MRNSIFIVILCVLPFVGIAAEKERVCYIKGDSLYYTPDYRTHPAKKAKKSGKPVRIKYTVPVNFAF